MGFARKLLFLLAARVSAMLFRAIRLARAGTCFAAGAARPADGLAESSPVEPTSWPVARIHLWGAPPASAFLGCGAGETARGILSLGAQNHYLKRGRQKLYGSLENIRRFRGEHRSTPILPVLADFFERVKLRRGWQGEAIPGLFTGGAG